MADVTKSTNDLQDRLGRLFIGTAEAAAVDELGYLGRENGIQIGLTHEDFSRMVQEVAGPVLSRTDINGFTLLADLEQVTNANLARTLGYQASTGVIGGGYRPPTYVSAMAIGFLESDRPWGYYLPKASIMPQDKTLQLAHNTELRLPYGLRAMDLATGMMQTTAGMAQGLYGMDSADVSIATGAATVTKGSAAKDIVWVKLGAESGSADDLDTLDGSVTYGASDDGRLLFLQPQSGDTITVTHDGVTANSFNLKGAADIDLANVHDWLLCYWDNTNSVWAELSNYLVP